MRTLATEWNFGQPSKMDPEVLDKWIASLRSGEFDQTTGNLCDLGTAYCCLGVLAEINGMDMHRNDEGLLDVLGNLMEKAAAGAGTEASSAPAVVMANMTETTATSLAELNDGGYGFDFIAKCLEGEREALLAGRDLFDHNLLMDYDEDYREEHDAWV